MASNGTHIAITNGHGAANGDAGTQSGLNVVVVGAGIGGLTAAIYLRKSGHHVTLLEQSRFANELGAAVHLAPNANGILRRIGIYAEKLGANPMEYVGLALRTTRFLPLPAIALADLGHLQLTEYDLSGKQTRHVSLEEPNKMWQHVSSFLFRPALTHG